MEQLTPLMDAIYAPQNWFLHLSPYISLTILGVIIVGVLSMAGVALARLGYKPLWALLLVVPTISVLGIWALALLPFPREKLK